MDDMSDWQLEEAARRAQDILSLAEGSGVLDSARVVAQLIESSGLTTQQMEAARAAISNAVMAHLDVDAVLSKVWVDAMPQIRLDQFFADMAKTAEIAKGIEALAVGVSLHIQATYAQMIASLVGLRRLYAGAGASFELTWGEGSADDDTQERRLVVPAADAFTLGEDATAEVIHGSASTTLDDVTGSATGQVIVLETLHLGVGLGVVTVDTPLATLISDTASLDLVIARREYAAGTLEVILRAKGPDAIARLEAGESVGPPIFWEALGFQPTYAVLPGRRLAGRKPDPENNIAYRRILDGGNTPEAADSAYAYWCGVRNIKTPTQADRDAFNQAMKRAAKRMPQRLPPDT